MASKYMLKSSYWFISLLYGPMFEELMCVELPPPMILLIF